MNAEIFSEWLRCIGYRVIRTHSSYWYDAGPRAYQAFPYHWLIRPSKAELTDLLGSNRAASLRYSTPLDNPCGRISYHVVYDGPRYDLDILERRARQNVRTGLKRCRVEPIPLERLAEEGWALEMDTASRQGRNVKTTRESWRRRYFAAAGLPGFEAWGALVENRLVATLLAVQVEDCCELISQQCHRDFIKSRVNHALTFTTTQALKSRPGVSSIFYALQSLDAPPSVDDFKFRMGYTAKPVRQRVVFHALLAPLVRPVSLVILERMMRWNEGNPALPKIAGMMRLYLEGKRPAADQDWPACFARRDAHANDGRPKE